MAMLIYALCAAAALACGLLLLARRRDSRMLLWSGLCFCGLALTNALIVVDALVDRSLWTERLVVALASIALLLYGLIFEEK